MVRWRALGKRLLVWLVAAALVAAAVGLVYGVPRPTDDGRVAAVQEDPRPSVAERDAVVDRARLDASRQWVPGGARFVELSGFDHSSFGAFRGQPGDGPATVSDAGAERELTRVLVDWFDDRSAAGG